MPTLSNDLLENYLPRARKLLVAAARQRKTITYGSIQNGIGGRGYVGQVLDALNKREHRAERPLLSALVVNAGGSGMPSVGFFKLVRELKPETRSVPNRQLWEAERERVWAFNWPQ